ncbi:MAG: hypothetical protein M3R53_02465 [Candidatus Eremiobacteraeota bacterium]|nr:hypothetical protein [Candidatus Eremiobacteraeota bacterium]
MLASPLPYDEDDVAVRIGTRSGRTAAVRRRGRTKRKPYRGFVRMFATAAALTLCVAVYLALMANGTRLNYELTKSSAERTRLRDQTARLDDRIARLDSREHLGMLAAKLGMHEPETLSEIVLPRARQAPVSSGIAFLTWLK